MEIESLAEGVDLSEPLTRARFEELVGDLLKKTLGPVKKVCPPLCTTTGSAAFLMVRLYDVQMSSAWTRGSCLIIT